MARHLQSKHKDKPEVAKAMAFQVGSKEQKTVEFIKKSREPCPQ